MGLALQLAEGLGIAFRDCTHEITDDDIILRFSEKPRPGKLILVEAGEKGTMFPFVAFDNEKEAVLCIGFYAKTETGFVKLDLSSLPKTVSEIIASGGVTVKYCESDICDFD